jgi:hypothetical protein
LRKDEYWYLHRNFVLQELPCCASFFEKVEPLWEVFTLRLWVRDMEDVFQKGLLGIVVGAAHGNNNIKVMVHSVIKEEGCCSSFVIYYKNNNQRSVHVDIHTDPSAVSTGNEQTGEVFLNRNIKRLIGPYCDIIKGRPKRFCNAFGHVDLSLTKNAIFFE